MPITVQGSDNRLSLSLPLRLVPWALIGIVWLAFLSTTVKAQTPAPTSSVALQVSELNTSLQSPWGLVFLPDGRMLVTEKGGTLKLLAANGTTLGNVSGVPAVNNAGQGGLLDVVIDPAFASNQRIYLTYAETDSSNPSLTGTAVARAKLDVGTRLLSEVKVIYR